MSIRTTRPWTIAAAVLVAVGSCPAFGQVVINEMVYDEANADSSDVVPDSREFVELYNAGASAVNIGDWTLESFNLGTGVTNFTDTIPGGTMLAPGDYYVIGTSAVPNVDLTLPSGGELWADTNILINLRDNGETLRDALAYETNKGLTGVTPEVTGQIAKGWWGNTQSYNTSYPRISLARFVDGRDTNNNGRDFGTIPMTPGTSNTLPFNTSYTIPDVDALSVGAPMPGTTGSFYQARTIDPTDAYQLGVDVDPLAGNYDNPALNQNPNAIPRSPQGGNAIIAWDPSGGGNLAISTERVDSFDLWAYLDSAPYVAGTAGAETTVYGIGTAGPLVNTLNPGGGAAFGTTGLAADITGLAWVFQKETNTSEPDHVKLYLVDANDGGDSRPAAADLVILGTIDLAGAPAAWHRLSIDVTPATGAVVAKYDGQTFNATTSTDLMGTFYVGYRESLVGTPITDYPLKVRPPTFDLFVAPAADADFDNDGDKDGADFLIWQRNNGLAGNNSMGDADGNGQVNGLDLALWKTNFASATAAAGSVPEPASAMIALLGAAAALAGRKTRFRRQNT